MRIEQRSYLSNLRKMVPYFCVYRFLYVVACVASP